MGVAKAWVDRSLKKAEHDVKPPRKKKQKGSLGESFAVLKSSPKILSLATLVMSYGVSHRLFEFAWKGQLRALYPSAQAYQVSNLLVNHSFAPSFDHPFYLFTCSFTHMFRTHAR